MDTKPIKGLLLITRTGRMVGAVDRIFFDPATKRVAGFVLQADGDPIDQGASLIEADGVPARGADRLAVAAATVAFAAPTGIPRPAPAAEEVAKLHLVTAGGRLLGEIAAIELDPETLQVARIEVAPGCFQGSRHVLADLRVRVGPPVAVVA